MNVLLTNDDGFHAPGLLALFRALETKHRVFVVAPEFEQSAVGHSITLADPIKVKEVKKNGVLYGYAVGGTPADCVRIAVSELIGEQVQVVVSGINLGANVGLNVLYSGTVSAGTEAAILGLPAFSISLDTFIRPDYSLAAGLAAKLIELLPGLGLPPGVSLNVNVPARPAAGIKGVAWTRQGVSPAGEAFSRRVDPRGNTYFWRGAETPPQNLAQDTDYTLLAQGFITITPLRHDLTHHEALSRLKNHKIEL
ncbi:MAG: 5'/3'-nucleotidase SurE [Thermodesulfobacteriota bacterium]